MTPLSPLTDAQLDRYQRQIILRDFGGTAQVRLAGAHMLVIGAGGIGCPAMQYLAAAGVGAITVIDDDVVSLTNLHRQILFTEQMIGLPKVQAAENMIRQYRPDINFHKIKQRLTAEFVHSQSATFFAAFAAIIDGSDNFATRLLVNDIALSHRIPLVSAAIGQFQGQLATLRGWLPNQPCYRCFVGDAFDAEDCDNCSQVGVLGPMVGVMGSYAAMEAVRAVTGFGEDQAGRLQLLDGLKLTMRTIRLTKDAQCKSCAAIADVD